MDGIAHPSSLFEISSHHSAFVNISVMAFSLAERAGLLVKMIEHSGVLVDEYTLELAKDPTEDLVTWLHVATGVGPKTRLISEVEEFLEITGMSLKEYLARQWRPGAYSDHFGLQAFCDLSGFGARVHSHTAP